jgi:benzoyl-CoA 2,3-dioxygenase component B
MQTSDFETLTEVPESVRSDAFVEVRTDDSIPNNVDLASDKQLAARAGSWHPGYLDWWKDMGPDGFQDAPSTCAPRSAWTRRAGPSSAT